MSKRPLFHQAVELSKVQKKYRPSEDQLRTEYLVQPKYNGLGCVVIKTAHSPEKITVTDKYGSESTSAYHVQESLAAAPFAPLGVYLGEYWHPRWHRYSLESVFNAAGILDTDPFFVVFDFLSLEEWEAGSSPLVYQDRVDRLPVTLSKIPETGGPFFLAESQGFLVDHGMSPQEAANLMATSTAYDGIILRKGSGTWAKGDKGTKGEIIKVYGDDGYTN